MAKAKSNKAPVTNSRLAALQAVAQEAVDTYEVDLSEESTGGGGKLLPEGWAFVDEVATEDLISGHEPSTF